MANKAIGRAIPTFTISVTAEGLNEKSEALGVAKYLGCNPVVVDCGHDEIRTRYPELIAAAEFPVIDTSCLGLLDLARSVHEHGYKVALTGEGADEWLAGYSWFKIHKLAGWMDKIPGLPFGYALRRMFLAVSGQPAFKYPAYRHMQTQVAGHNGWLDLWGVVSVNKLRFFTGAAREHALKHSAIDDLEVPTEELKRWHPFNRQMYFGARVMLCGHLLASKGDRVAMNSSVETRYAFLDEDVIAYMSKLHPRWKLRGVMKDKFVERKVAERWLPKEVAWRRKKMFRAPMDSWKVSREPQVSATASWIEQILSPESIRKAGYFDADAVAQARQRLAKPGGGLTRTGVEMGLTGVLATQLWHHLYLGGGLCDLPEKQFS
jgi:asparagine synthase (glutamine-hydrolysing)